MKERDSLVQIIEGRKEPFNYEERKKLQRAQELHLTLAKHVIEERHGAVVQQEQATPDSLQAEQPQEQPEAERPAFGPLR